MRELGLDLHYDPESPHKGKLGQIDAVADTYGEVNEEVRFAKGALSRIVDHEKEGQSEELGCNNEISQQVEE
jgi:hypothetical protein